MALCGDDGKPNCCRNGPFRRAGLGLGGGCERVGMVCVSEAERVFRGPPLLAWSRRRSSTSWCS
eukprot:COSAG02_NODE_1982_length_10196_cov_6.214816_11_plen_64_part_00